MEAPRPVPWNYSKIRLRTVVEWHLYLEEQEEHQETDQAHQEEYQEEQAEDLNNLLDRVIFA